jgi:hypothetical protein
LRSRGYGCAGQRWTRRAIAGCSFGCSSANPCDTDFQPATTYKSQQGTSGADLNHPVFPLPSGGGLTDPAGQTLQTIPYFATDINGTHDYDGNVANANIRTVQIPAGKDQEFAYYGCFLDIYDAAGNAKNLAGTHHCIVAEIACSEAPIPGATGTGAAPTPMNWDQLAQRNLQITLRRIPSPARPTSSTRRSTYGPVRLHFRTPGRCWACRTN